MYIIYAKRFGCKELDVLEGDSDILDDLLSRIHVTVVLDNFTIIYFTVSLIN
jgi:hypothetical protein